MQSALAGNQPDEPDAIAEFIGYLLPVCRLITRARCRGRHLAPNSATLDFRLCWCTANRLPVEQIMERSARSSKGSRSYLKSPPQSTAKMPGPACALWPPSRQGTTRCLAECARRPSLRGAGHAVSDCFAFRFRASRYLVLVHGICSRRPPAMSPSFASLLAWVPAEHLPHEPLMGTTEAPAQPRRELRQRHNYQIRR